MTMSTPVSLAAIGRQLQVEYSPTAGESLPREIEELLAQLVALEADRRESAEFETMHPAAALPKRPS
jgi:hypothetical protein